MTKYRTIVADPPWPDVSARLGKGGRRANETELPYKRMSYESIRALDVEAVAEDDCALFMWSTRRTFREGEAAAVARAWGFEPCGEMIWGLRNAGTGAPPFGNDHEPVLVAKRGAPMIALADYLGVFFWKQLYEYGPSGVPQKVHSAKPLGFYDLIEQISASPRLELFARTQRLGWDSWGNEALNHVELSA